MDRTDVIVVGGGPAGYAAALATAAAGVATTLIAGPMPTGDNRTTALLAGSVKALETLGVWDRCKDKAAPLRVMRLVDDTHRLLRAPEVAFDCNELGLDAFGWNIANSDLMAAFRLQASSNQHLHVVEATATHVSTDDNIAIVTLNDGTPLAGRVLFAADGRKSMTREAAGIAMRAHPYPQVAVTLNLAHTRPHNDNSTEFHTPTGPFTLVPLPGDRSSLVCVVDQAQADLLMAMDDATLALELERRAQSILGRFTIEKGRAAWPLSSITAERFGARRVLLIGEAGHVFPPIGAQGLNLGLRDAAIAAELVVGAQSRGDDPGSDDITAAYDRQRRADVTLRTTAVDVLNRSLLSAWLPVHGLRGAGLYALKTFGPLRRMVMREGVAPRLSEPRLMRGEALSV
jgi:2-octaprenyl-6-methoxyphenol hydroxylase